VSDRAQLPALTGLRFVAALWVVVFHMWRWEKWDAPAVVENLVAGGPIAVTLFFVLSGFILTWTYADGEKLKVSTGAFFAARLARVYPLHVLALVIAFPVVVAVARRDGGDVSAEMWRGLSALVLVQAWWPDLALAWNPPAWSISAEAFFYLSFPFIAPLVLRGSRPAAWAVGAGAFVASLLPSVLYLATDPDGLGTATHASHGFWLGALKYHPVARLPEFVMGVVAGRLFLSAPRSPRASLYGAAAGGVVIGFVVAGALPYALTHNGLFAPLFALVIVGLASGEGLLTRLLSTRPLQRLGEASYALYLLHVPLLYWASGVGERVTGGEKILERPLTAAFVLAGILLASRLAYVLVEQPARTRLRRLLIP
jgi:peptidoglycan/LPS O-acetylase OafA/YrhL